MEKFKKAAIIVSAMLFSFAGGYTAYMVSAGHFNSSLSVSADDCVSDGLIYVKNDDGTITIKGHTADADLVNIVIPDEIEGCPVTEIGSKAFYQCNSMSTLVLGRNVRSIGEQAFGRTGGILYYDLDELTVSDNLNIIADNAFYYLKIKKLTVPESVKSLSSQLLSHQYLTSINVESGNEFFSSDQGVLYNADKSTLIKCPKATEIQEYSVSDKTTEISDKALYGCNCIKKLDLGRNVRSIGSEALACGIFSDEYDEIIIPDCIDSISDDSIGNITIKSLTVPKTVRKIPSCFYDDSDLQQINVESGNQYFSSDNGVLYNADKTTLIKCPMSTQLTAYSVSDQATEISEYAFFKCVSIKSIDLGKNTKVINDYAFASTIDDSLIDPSMTLNEVTLSDCIEAVGINAFNHTYIHELKVPESVGYIPEIFYNSIYLKNIEVEEGNKKYCSDNGVLYNGDKSILIKCPPESTVVSFRIDDNTTTISNYAFYDCRSLTNLYFGKNVSHIGEFAFCSPNNYYFMKLSELSLPDKIEDIDPSSFIGTQIITLTVDESVTVIPQQLYSKDSLTAINVDENNKDYSSEKGVLYNKDKSELIKCPASSALLLFSVSENTKTIDDMAFEGTKVQNMYIPQSVTQIGEDTFKSSGLKTIKGVKDSYAQSYAEAHDIEFIAVDAPSQSSVTTATTTVTTTTPAVTTTTSAPTETKTPQTTVVTGTTDKAQKFDLNGDGKVNIMDILKIKQYVLSGE